jgi:DNA replication factor GINS
MMDLDELQSVRDRERQTDKLQQLRESFYADAGEFIQQLRDQRERAAERADDPFDAPEVNRLSDEIDTAEVTVEAIYEKRVGKIVKAASFAAADLPAQEEGMTREEQDLFETLVGDIKSNREHVLDVLAGERPGGQSTDDPGGDADAAVSETDGVSAADAMGDSGSPGADGTPAAGPDGTPPRDREGPAGDPDRTAGGDPPAREAGQGQSADRSAGDGAFERATVRITDDVGAIFGVDEREYDLSTDDVVQLPAANADPLVERDAAERLD